MLNTFLTALSLAKKKKKSLEGLLWAQQDLTEGIIADIITLNINLELTNIQSIVWDQRKQKTSDHLLPHACVCVSSNSGNPAQVWLFMDLATGVPVAQSAMKHVMKKY